MPRLLLLALIVASLSPAAASAHTEHGDEGARAASVQEPCPGDPIDPDRVITGFFESDLAGSYVMVPFQVPRGTTSVRVKYCWDEPEDPVRQEVSHTIDLGLWDTRGFRGWGGSSHPDVTLSPQGFSSLSQYLARPRGHVPGRTTRAFIPGPIPRGEWHVELGAMAIASREQGDLDDGVAWRVELEFSDDPSHAANPYRPARYREAPARPRPGWYDGDMHVHAEHSALGDAPMREVFDYGFRQVDLDFILLTDYVTTSAWGEIGRHQPRYPRRLIGRSSEIITPRGHAANHVSERYVDHRTGPVYELGPQGRLSQVRGRTPASRMFRAIRRAGGFTQIAHPTIFPSENPLFRLICRGCPWDYGAAATNYDLVDAIEVSTGPPGFRDEVGNFTGPNPFTLTAIDFYEDALARGHHIAALAVSDSHHAGRTPNPFTQSPVGTGRTVVRAPELSEKGVQCGVERGHTYAKLWGEESPDLRLWARPPGWTGRRAIFGDTVRGSTARFTARVLNPRSGSILQVYRNGELHSTHPLTGERTTVNWTAGPGRYRLQVMRGTSVEALSTPIWVRAGGQAVVARRQRCPAVAAAQPPAPAPRFTG